MDDDLETYFEGSPDENEGNKDAERALMRVKQKLDGYEGGEMRSVHGQVDIWINSKRKGKKKNVFISFHFFLWFW